MTTEVLQGTTNDLLMSLLEAIKSGKLNQEVVVKLLERVNFTIFNHCSQTEQTAWVEYIVKVLTQGIEGL